MKIRSPSPSHECQFEELVLRGCVQVCQVLVLGFEWCVTLAVNDNLCNGTNCASHTDEETNDTDTCQHTPSERKPLHIVLHKVHLDGQEYSQWPETKTAQEAQNVIEEWQQHCNHCRQT